MADQKLTDLTADTLPAAADIVYIVVDPGGSPLDRKMTHDDLLFGANGTPSTQAHGDSAAIGTALDAARSDHKHAMPAAGGGTEATQAEIEAKTSGALFIPPDLAQHIPGVLKAHGLTNGAGTLQSGSENVTSTTKDSTGRYTWTWATDFADAIYSMAGVVNETTAGGVCVTDRTGNATTAGKTSTFITVHMTDGDDLGDLPHYVMAWGDQ